ncbi:MAG: MlaD family protein [Candidatus Delongbacteria bacterium]|jgi:phospholipid/cholesterol/gamma-HCH transport system substrate-binding protein|nr:MlaD family protein [Candidatus Delongbacteria bacterium]
MVTRSQKIRVIVLISIVSIIFLYVMFLLVGRKIFTSEDTYYIKLEKQSVSGLNIGADVKYYGINIGKVVDIAINKENTSEIIVTINITQDTPIKSGSVANLPYQSIATGLKLIEITGGDNNDPNLEPESFINVGTDMFDNITGKAEVISGKIEILLNNLIQATSNENRSKLFNMISQIEKDAQRLDTLLSHTSNYLNDNKGNISSLIKNSDKMVKEFTVTASSINKLMIKTSNLIEAGKLEESLKNIQEITEKLNTKEIANLVSSINKLIGTSQETVQHFDKTFLLGRRNLLTSIELFKEALENINEFAILLRDNPDILIKGKE